MNIQLIFKIVIKKIMKNIFMNTRFIKQKNIMILNMK